MIWKRLGTKDTLEADIQIVNNRWKGLPSTRLGGELFRAINASPHEAIGLARTIKVGADLTSLKVVFTVFVRASVH